MSEVVHNGQHEFWRPPGAQQAVATPVMVEACDRCGTEFMVGARFCHICGTGRQTQVGAFHERGWTRHLEFQNIMQALGNIAQGLSLSRASLIAFVVGVACLLGVIAVGAIYTVQNFADFQAIQLYRIQWLLAALAAFVAAILLKKTPGTKT
jgi:hypothetical protein